MEIILRYLHLKYFIFQSKICLHLTEISISFMYSVICMETIYMHYVLSYFLHKILFEEFLYEIRIPYVIKGVKFICYACVCIVRSPI